MKGREELMPSLKLLNLLSLLQNKHCSSYVLVYYAAAPGARVSPACETREAAQESLGSTAHWWDSSAPDSPSAASEPWGHNQRNYINPQFLNHTKSSATWSPELLSNKGSTIPHLIHSKENGGNSNSSWPGWQTSLNRLPQQTTQGIIKALTLYSGL